MTAEQLHDALGMLPSDLITETDKLRSRPHKTVIYWRQLAAVAACAVLILGCGLLFMGRFLPAMGGSSKEATVEQDAALSYSALNGTADMAAPEERKETGAAAGAATGDSVAEVPMAEAEEGLTPTGYPADGAYFIDLTAAQVCLTQPLPSVNLRSDDTQAVILRTEAELTDYRQSHADSLEMASFAECCGSFDGDWFAAYDLLVIRTDTEKSELVPIIHEVTLTGPAACEVTLAFAEMSDDNTLDPACWHILLPVEKGLLPEDTAIDIK